jgi:aldose 1-epimerase
MQCESSSFGEIDGQVVQQFATTNSAGLELWATDFGAIVTAVKVPARNGQIANVTLGFAELAGYQQRHPYFGATVGRYGNRIAQGKFSLDGQEYQLATNNGPNHLHGGVVGFDRYIWTAEAINEDDEAGIRFSRISADGEEGYPGNLHVSVSYTLNERNELTIRYHATTDLPTVLNLTNHNYWNLGGAGSGHVLDHELQLTASQFVEVDDSLLPTGQLASVAETPLDFREAVPIGRRIGQVGGEPMGYDHCYVVPGKSGELQLAARIIDPQSGRGMKVETTEPGIQLYTGNFLDGSAECGGFDAHEAFCLETQHFPDSPNHPIFPTTRLEPGQEYTSTTRHTFFLE